MSALLANIRYALRQFRLAPVFTAAAVLTLALGIGGTTAIFTLIHAVMLRSLPVGDPAALYRVGDGPDCCVESGPQEEWGMVSYPLYQRLKAETPEFEQVTAFQAGRGRMSVRRQGTDATANVLRSEYVSGAYFTTLGVRAFGGRVFAAEDDEPASPPVAVISHHIWQTTYAADPAVIGATFIIEGHPFTVIGVAPPGFFGEMLQGDPPDLWIPLHQEPLIAAEGSRLKQAPAAWLRMIGRLRSGATTNGMSARLTGVLRQWLLHESDYPANWMKDVERMIPKQTIAVIPAGSGVAGMKDDYGQSLEILLCVCALVLLIACANVANLLLTRAVTRRGQTALRMAVGASRGQIVRQALTEAVLLAVGGGIAGMLVAAAGARLLLNLFFHNARFLPVSVSPSLAVLGFAFVLALVTGMIFGAAPAWFATRTSPAEALRSIGRSGGDRSSVARTALLVVQAALSVVLVAGAAMLARSMANLERQNFGFTASGRVEVGLQTPPATYTRPQLDALYRQMEERLGALPGVRSAGLALYNPLTDNWGEMIYVSGHPPPQMDNESEASWNRVSASYLQDLGVGLVRGRHLNAGDNDTAPLVAVVNEAFVKRFFKAGEDPIDQHFGMDYPEYAGMFKIVGVVRDARFAGWGMRRPIFPMFYLPLAQSAVYRDPIMKGVELHSHFIGGIVLVTDQPPGTLEPVVARTLASIDPNLSINSVRTMNQQIERVLSEDHAVAALAQLFGIVALVLAAIGLYGVTAYSVTQRTNEIGVRMALGATRSKVVRMVLGGAFQRVFIGLALGLPLAVGGGRLISAQLYGVRSWDPSALAIAAGALGICSLVAALIPAGRAASVSPMSALRTE